MEVLKMLPNQAEKVLVMCDNEECFAYQNNQYSVIKINWLIRCQCCEKAFDSFYFERLAKKGGQPIE
jgi:hypothetical protein